MKLFLASFAGLALLAGSGCASSSLREPPAQAAKTHTGLNRPLQPPPLAGDLGEAGEDYRKQVRHRMSQRTTEIRQLQIKAELAQSRIHRAVLSGAVEGVEEDLVQFIRLRDEILLLRRAAEQEFLLLSAFLSDASVLLSRQKEQGPIALAYRDLSREYRAEALQTRQLVESAERQREEAVDLQDRVLNAARQERSPTD